MGLIYPSREISREMKISNEYPGENPVNWPRWEGGRDFQPSAWPVVCVGPGRVGSALCRALSELGFPVVGVGGGSGEWSGQLASELGTELIEEPYEGLGEKARLILVTPPDSNLADVAVSIGRGAELKAGSCLLQTSATEPSEALLPATAGMEGITCLSFHPMKPFNDRKQGLEHFVGTVLGIEGDGRAKAIGHALANLVGGHPLDISRQDKSIYHAAGVLAFTGAMALAWAAEQISEHLDLDSIFIKKGIVPNMSTAAGTVLEPGLPEGLTGPVSRGDVEVVEQQIRALADRFPDFLPVYREVALLNVRMLEKDGLLERDVIERLKEVLSE